MYDVICGLVIYAYRAFIMLRYVLLFIFLREREGERETESAHKYGAEAERDRKADSSLSREPEVVLDLETMPQTESNRPTN